MAEQITEDRVKGICRSMIDKDCETFCPLRHQPIINTVQDMKKDNEVRDRKMDKLLNIALITMGGIITSLLIQVLNLLSKAGS